MRYARRVLALLLCTIGIGTLAGRVGAGEPASPRPSAPLKAVASTESLDRTILPIPEPDVPPITELDVRNAKAPPRFEVKAPSAPTCSSF